MLLIVLMVLIVLINSTNTTNSAVEVNFFYVMRLVTWRALYLTQKPTFINTTRYQVLDMDNPTA